MDRQKCYPEISEVTPQIAATLESWNDNESSLSTKSKHNEHTVGGRNPGPPGMYKAPVNNGIFKSYSSWLAEFRDPSSVWFFFTSLQENLFPPRKASQLSSMSADRLEATLHGHSCFKVKDLRDLRLFRCFFVHV